MESKAPWSNLDYNDSDLDMHYLKQPRGKGFSFRMATPPELIGLPNPWTGKALGKEIIRGLNTRRLTNARRQRDIFLGDIRRMQEAVRGSTNPVSHTNALALRDQIAKASTVRKPSHTSEAEALELVATTIAEHD